MIQNLFITVDLLLLKHVQNEEKKNLIQNWFVVRNLLLCRKFIKRSHSNASVHALVQNWHTTIEQNVPVNYKTVSHQHAYPIVQEVVESVPTVLWTNVIFLLMLYQIENGLAGN